MKSSLRSLKCNIIKDYNGNTVRAGFNVIVSAIAYSNASVLLLLLVVSPLASCWWKTSCYRYSYTNAASYSARVSKCVAISSYISYIMKRVLHDRMYETSSSDEQAMEVGPSISGLLSRGYSCVPGYKTILQ
jgi:hypothetical protein